MTLAFKHCTEVVSQDGMLCAESFPYIYIAPDSPSPRLQFKAELAPDTRPNSDIPHADQIP
jgi:hypothetical protein